MCFQNSQWAPIVHPFPDWEVIKQGADFLNDNYEGEEMEKGRNGTGQCMDLHMPHTSLGVQNILRDKETSGGK